MKIVFKKIIGSWLFRLILIPILSFLFIRMITNYYYSAYSDYGMRYNYFRSLHNIPQLDSYMKVVGPRGWRWESSKSPSDKQPVVHKWKNVIATDSEGWIEEMDGYLRSVNDTMTTQLNIFTKKNGDKIEITGQIGYHSKSLWKELRSGQVDSVRRKWGI